ncbi:MAG: hypothetical protein GEV11_03405 [Streptosporangiales bacterium]|nr:hypothetical protein [Streptosporangiales bacterium]
MFAPSANIRSPVQTATAAAVRSVLSRLPRPPPRSRRQESSKIVRITPPPPRPAPPGGRPAAANGESLVSPSITVRLLAQLARPSARAAAAREPEEPLTVRELDVVRRVARGRTNEEIAADLVVAASTVKSHLGSVYRKLGARNRVEVAAWAWESGLLG